MKLEGTVHPRSAALVLTAAALFLGLALLGCSKSYNPTSPYGGGSSGGSNMGGGGAGGAAFNSGTMNAPATFVHTFATAGGVGYHCSFHQTMGMVGTVMVQDGAADSAVVAAAGTSFTPPVVNIKPGGYVRWTVTNGTHTVTSD